VGGYNFGAIGVNGSRKNRTYYAINVKSEAGGASLPVFGDSERGGEVSLEINTQKAGSSRECAQKSFARHKPDVGERRGDKNC